MADNILEGTETADISVRRTQVYQVTHDGEGNSLPFMNRSFISFSYGGKNIEDFNLIATTSGDRWQQNGYANFNDLTTSYDVLDGQFFWASHYQTYELDLELSTDGVTQNELDEFLHWFTPGKYRELVLAEHPNRARLARVAAVPALSMIPFEKKVEFQIGGQICSTSTTEYKGSISLKLVSDDPFWHARVNIFGNTSAQQGEVKWKDANGKEIENIYKDKDVLKVILEDGIPAASMIPEDKSIILGDGTYMDASILTIQKIWSGNPPSGEGAEISPADSSQEPTGMTAGARVVTKENNSGISLSNNDALYFYYAGTAPAPLHLEFTLTPQFSNDGYISCPRNNSQQDASITDPYNTITITNLATKSSQNLHITTPNIYHSYNQVINIFDTKDGTSWVDIKNLIRDCVHHAGVRAYAIKVIEPKSNNSINYNASTDKSSLKAAMQEIFKNNDNTTILPAIFIIDSKTGSAIGKFQYRDTSNEPELVPSEENVQDMLLSNNLFIRERNHPIVDKTTGNLVINRDTVHKLSHNFSSGLSNVKIIYDNLYL